MVLTRLLWPELKVDDKVQREKGTLKLPGKLTGAHKLEAWGIRIGCWKGDYTGGFDAWSKDMQDYCEQDVKVTSNLWHRCQLRLTDAIVAKKGIKTPFIWPQNVVDLEHDVQRIVARQEAYGWAFNETAAQKLWGTLRQRQEDVERELVRQFDRWYMPKRTREGNVKTMTPKRDNKRMGYVEGGTFSIIDLQTFNPGSTRHVSDRLMTLYGWKPTEFTPGGEPKLDEEVISKLPYEETKLLGEYLMIQKRLGQLALGPQAWLKKVECGRIHGGVNTLGTVTGRMSHSHPNIAQVPANGKPYGVDCRGLFGNSMGSLVGADADGLELRLLAGYMALYDGGEYVKTVLEGDKALGTDMHSVNCRALGMDPATHRDVAKTWFYAFIYGAGDGKLGAILGGGAKLGKASRAKFLENLPALGSLVKAVKKRRKQKGYMVGGGR